MRYQMRQKLVSFGDDFTIKDRGGRPVYYVDGRALALRQRLEMRDTQGNEVAEIRERFVSLLKTYDIYRDGRHFATLSKQISIFRDRFEVDVPGPNDYSVRGNILDYEYSIYRQGQQVAQVSKGWFTIRDSYGIDIVAGEDDVIILATAVVLDLITHNTGEG
ncbi:MAG: LURP-one-related family protein [Chloroflexota bacterium]